MASHKKEITKKIFVVNTKGQLISECRFGVFKSPTKPTKLL